MPLPAAAWSERCQRQVETHRRYAELAKFRSEKCNFPGPNCGYTEADIGLMWQYIENTAPLCGKLIKALAEVEKRFRQMGVESLEKHGGVEEKTKARTEIVLWRLKEPVYATVALWEKRLYVFYDKMSLEGRLRGNELEEVAREAIQGGVRVEIYDVDDEYKRLWLEVPLPKSVSGLLGGRDKAPVALFRNLGWLLSDDARQDVKHGASNPGQVALRVFDWIALAKYAVDVLRIASARPLMFRPAIYQIAETGKSPIVEARSIGATADIIKRIYNWFGITLGETERVLMQGYAVLKALRGEAFRKEGRMYVVNDVGAWIAFSNVVDMLVIGDGYITPVELRVVAKATPRETLQGETTLMRELAKALGATAGGGGKIRLREWYMRLLLPTPPTPAFDKTGQLYEALTNYPVAAKVEIGGDAYLLYHNGGGEFVIGREKAKSLNEAIYRLGLTTRAKKNLLVLTYAQLKELAKRGFAVKFLNDIEKMQQQINRNL